MRSSRAATASFNREHPDGIVHKRKWLTVVRYIGELMQTSKITSTGAGKAAKSKGKGRIIK
jgi:hypothetical protein